MRWKRTLQTVDVHCAGEIGRVITGGVLDIPGDTMAAKLAHINEVDDSLRRWLCSEPRAAANHSFVLIPPACHPEADFGMIVLQTDRAHAMSGSNSMCAVTAILETGMMEMVEPETVVTLDTAAGLVRATAACRDGKVTGVSLDMPPAFVAISGAEIETPDWGRVVYDLCYGGVFYALVDVDQIGSRIAPENARELAEKGVALRDLIAAQTNIVHPEIAQLHGLAYVMFRSCDADGGLRTCTTLKPARTDRSPCGTGTNSTMAVLHATGDIAPGDRIITRSIINGEFSAELLGEAQIGPYKGSRVRITGQCWIYGISQIGLDPGDPFPSGFILSDTWGG
ncbi:proline racemase family protein [Marinovum sp. 2_MG-2023]|uniref:proline racemase family protein n=1 Tax=unclassified Marinovum TaxID=2647166 RepID=UPI0026E44CD1|nr:MULTISPECIES: proline racemase family protein [unclassified Marinovum]MDO6729211.1 proline racemase family protein [Marinovum sp. 2_MG-2023]MDO6779162.1 proline racemase family protein [Marinovum sp. 1_MG-2023]